MNVTRQTRIFVPRNELYNHALWAETVIGKIICPLVKIHENNLVWFWFTRYDLTKEQDSDDCDINKIPAAFMNPENQHYRSVRFRYCLSDELRESFEHECHTLIIEAQCTISGFRGFDFPEQLGDVRHLEGERTPERIQRRAQLVVENYCSVARLILDALSGPDGEGRYWLPHFNTDPWQSTPFQVIHHIFCNSTDVPLYVQYPEHVPSGPTSKPQHIIRFQRVWF